MSNSTYKPHLPRNHTEKHRQDHKLHAGTAITPQGGEESLQEGAVFQCLPCVPVAEVIFLDS
jgi:hypothetical protein